MFEPDLCTTREDAWRSVWQMTFTLAAMTLMGAVGWVLYVVCTSVLGV